MWKLEYRSAADRSGLRYPSDLTGRLSRTGPARRAAPLGERARSVERDLLDPVDRLPMAGLAGLEPSSTSRNQKGPVLLPSLDGTPGEGMLMRRSGPCSLNRITQSRKV